MICIVCMVIPKLFSNKFSYIVSMEGRFPFLLGCLPDSRTVSFCFSFGHVARYAPSISQFEIVWLSASKLMPTLTMDRPQRAKRAG